MYISGLIHFRQLNIAKNLNINREKSSSNLGDGKTKMLIENPHKKHNLTD